MLFTILRGHLIFCFILMFFEFLIIQSLLEDGTINTKELDKTKAKTNSTIAVMRFVVVNIIPIVNLIIFLVMVFHAEEIGNKINEELHKK